MDPTVSCYANTLVLKAVQTINKLTCSEIGMTRFLDVKPTAVYELSKGSHIHFETSNPLGLIPTRLLFDEGDMMEPSVSVPNAARARPRDDATPEPEELPLGSCFG